MSDLKEFYQSNERFRGYVDRCVTYYHGEKSVEEVLELALAREVAKSYMEQEQGYVVASTYAPIGECV